MDDIGADIDAAHKRYGSNVRPVAPADNRADSLRLDTEPRTERHCPKLWVALSVHLFYVGRNGLGEYGASASVGPGERAMLVSVGQVRRVRVPSQVMGTTYITP